MVNDATGGSAGVNCQRGGDVYCFKLFGPFSFLGNESSGKIITWRKSYFAIHPLEFKV